MIETLDILLMTANKMIAVLRKKEKTPKKRLSILKIGLLERIGKR